MNIEDEVQRSMAQLVGALLEHGIATGDVRTQELSLRLAMVSPKDLIEHWTGHG